MFYSKLIISASLSFVTLWGSTTSESSAATTPETYYPTRHSDTEEVFLSFKYRGTGTVVIAALYSNGQFYLPVTELFKTLMIPHETDLSRLIIRGTYPPQGQRYELHLR